MTTPIRCQVDTSQRQPTFDCEPVELTNAAPSDDALMSMEGGLCLGPPINEAEQPDAAARALVARVTTTTTILPPAAVPLGPLIQESALMCLSELDAVAILAASKPTPLVAILTSFKVAYDVGKCAGTEYSQAKETLTRQAAVDRCDAQGGVSPGFVGDSLECVTVREVAP